MPNPADEFRGSSEGIRAVGSHGLGQFRRVWKADEPVAEILILHGISEHSGRYQHVGATFAAAGYRARSFDHQGFGRSAGARAFVQDYEHYLDDIEQNLALARESGLPVVLLGHSLGGQLAVSYAISDRPQPDVLLLSGPSLDANYPAWQKLLAPILGSIAPRFFLESDFDGSMLATDPDVGAAHEADPLRVSGGTMRMGQQCFAGQKHARANVDKLRVPTFLVHGRADQIVPVECTEVIGDHPLATRVVLDGLEHEVLNEPSWRETVQQMIDFCDETLFGGESTSSEEE